MFTESMMPSNHLILCYPLLLLPSIFPSIRVLSNELALHIRWPKCWSSSISPSNEYSGLISFRIGWFDLLAIQGTQESSPAPQFESLNSLASSYFMGQVSHPYMTAGKTVALTLQTFVGKVISLPFNMLSRFIILFLPGGTCLNFMAAGSLSEHQKYYIWIMINLKSSILCRFFLFRNWEYIKIKYITCHLKYLNSFMKTLFYEMSSFLFNTLLLQDEKIWSNN